MRSPRYDWAGAALGAGLLLVATLIAAWHRHGSLGAEALLAVQASEPLLWLIDTAPLVGAALGWGIERQRGLVAAHQERIAIMERQRRISLERTATELSGTALNLLADVSSLGSASAQMTASVRGTLETMTALSHGATAAALAAETVAGRALEIASKPSPTADELAAALRSAAKGAKEIARIAQEQMDGIERVLASMNEIHFATEAAAETTRAIAVEAQALSKHARGARSGAGFTLEGLSGAVTVAATNGGRSPSRPAPVEGGLELNLGFGPDTSADMLGDWGAADEGAKPSCAS